MIIREVLKKYKHIEIELLLAEVLKKPKEFLYIHTEYQLSSYQVKKLSSLVRRRKRGEPIAYILGYKDFYGLRFKVNKDVLIPRPETEELVDLVLQNVVQALGLPAALSKQQGKALHYKDRILRILDVGTGSGCIAITLAHKLKVLKLSSYKVVASDISTAALKVARVNAKTILKQNLNTIKYLSFVKSDLLKNIKFDPDIIVANLPYVPEGDLRFKIKDKSLDQKALGYEPRGAIFAKENGLFIIRKLLEQITQRNQKPEYIFLEFDPRQKILLSSLIKKTLPEFKTIFHKDLHKRWRFLEIKKAF
jgi:release factor glutamine methyltransferase